MRARLKFVPSGWEAEEEMDGRLRGLIGGGEDIFFFHFLSVCLRLSPFLVPFSAVLGMDVI